MPVVFALNEPPEIHRRARLAVSMLFLLNGLLFASWVSRLPLIQSTRGMAHDTLGLGLLGMALGALVAMPAAGLCCASYGSRSVSIMTAVAYCVLLPCLAIAPNGWPFFTCLFMFGVVHGAIDVSMNAQAVEVEAAYGKPIMSSFHALFSGGGLAGSAIGGGFAALGLAPFAHFMFMAAVLLLAAALYSFPNLLRFNKAKANTNTDHPDSTPSTQASNYRRSPSPQLILIGIVTFACMLGEGAMADWSAIYLREAASAPEWLAAISYAAFSVTMMLGRLMGDHLALRHGAVKLVRYGGILSLAGIMMALLFPQPWIALLGFAAIGAGLSTVVPCAFSAAGRVENMHPSFALSTITTIGYFGFLIGPPLIGFIAEATSLRIALGTLIITSALMTLLANVMATKARILQISRLPDAPASDSV